MDNLTVGCRYVYIRALMFAVVITRKIICPLKPDYFVPLTPWTTAI